MVLDSSKKRCPVQIMKAIVREREVKQLLAQRLREEGFMNLEVRYG